jgi:hypothetical protein
MDLIVEAIETNGNASSCSEKDRGAIARAARLSRNAAACARETSRRAASAEENAGISRRWGDNRHHVPPVATIDMEIVV